MTVSLPLTSLAGRIGHELGVSDWLAIAQDRIDRFAVADKADAVQVTWGVVVERDGHVKPCLVLDWQVRYHRQP